MKITTKPEQTPQNTTTQTEFQNLEADNKLALLKHLTEVQSNIQDKISTDFVLAKLDEQNKEGVIEMTTNAYFSTRVIDIITTNSKKNGRYNWNRKNKNWERTNHPITIYDEIKKIQQQTFNSYMVRIYMTIILARNHEKNHLINVLATSVSGVQHISDENADKIQDTNKLKEFLKIAADKKEEIK